MDSHKRLLANNRAWVERKLALESDYFESRAGQHTPDFLWIGCSDSRVPAEEITGVEPGELMVHRNIANLVVHTDFNMLSVLQYSVQVLGVKHVILCGHYGCGGVQAAMSRKDLGLINKWLRHVKDIYRLHSEELDAIADEQARYERLVDLNVVEQVHHLAEMSFVQKAWAEETRPTIHGWVYDLHTGHLKQIIQVDPGQTPHEIYAYEFEKA